jgi:general secretion pathway protein D
MTVKRIMLLSAVLLHAACATDTRFAEGKRLLTQGQTEAGLELLEKATRDNPRQSEVRAYWMRERELAITRLTADAEVSRMQGRIAEAELFYGRALKIDPNDVRAKGGMEALTAARRHEQQLREAESRLERKELEAAEAIVRNVLAENSTHPQARTVLRRIVDAMASRSAVPPVLKAGAVKPVNLEFRDAPLRSVFEVIAKTSGINFVFDKDVRPDLRSTIVVRNSTVDDVIRLILVTNQLERKVLNDNTILVYPNTPAKLKEYQELVVRSFYLANADVKQTLTMIKTMVKTRDVFIDEKLGLLVMKDTPDAVRLAEKLIAAQDLAEPEVTLEVEVLEVATNRVQELGLRAPEQVILTNPATVPASGAPVSGTLARASSGLTAFVATPPIIINLRQQDGVTNVLANPRIRVKNREKARIHIGDRVPVVTTTATANVGVSASVSYLDVGLKLDVEPAIQLEGEVIMKVGLEVSNITREVATTGGGLAYQLGTRNAATTLRLRDGETQVLAGLIQDDERRIANKVPGLGSLPVLGRLFSNNNETKTKTEIVLLITPRIVRALLRPDHVSSEYYSGTESNVGAQPLSIRPTAGSVTMSSSPVPGGAQQQAPQGSSPSPQPATPQPQAVTPPSEPTPSQPEPLGSQPQPLTQQPVAPAPQAVTAPPAAVPQGTNTRP